MAGLCVTGALFMSLIPLAGTLTHRVAVSSDIRLCGFTCDKAGIYTLGRVAGVSILDYSCWDKSVYLDSLYESRAHMNVSAGCCIIHNAQKSDTGEYLLEFQGFLQTKQPVQTSECFVMDPVSVTNITTNRSGENVALSVSYSGEETTVLWTWNGGALPERHQLSDSNKTLTVPSTDTGTFTVLVSNPVSHTSTHYNLTLPGSAFPCSSPRYRTGILAAPLFVVMMCVY